MAVGRGRGLRGQPADLWEFLVAETRAGEPAPEVSSGAVAIVGPVGVGTSRLVHRVGRGRQHTRVPLPPGRADVAEVCAAVADAWQLTSSDEASLLAARQSRHELLWLDGDVGLSPEAWALFVRLGAVGPSWASVQEAPEEAVVHVLEVPPLQTEQAIAFLRDRAAPHEVDDATAAEVVAAVGGLPAGLELAASNLWMGAELVLAQHGKCAVASMFDRVWRELDAGARDALLAVARLGAPVRPADLVALTGSASTVVELRRRSVLHSTEDGLVLLGPVRALCSRSADPRGVRPRVDRVGVSWAEEATAAIPVDPAAAFRRLGELRPLLRTVVVEGETSLRLRAATCLSHLFRWRGTQEERVRVLQEVLAGLADDDGDLAHLRRELAYALRAAGHPVAECLRWLEGDDHPIGLRGRGAFALHRGDLAEARRWLDEAIDKAPPDSVTRMLALCDRARVRDGSPADTPAIRERDLAEALHQCRERSWVFFEPEVLRTWAAEKRNLGRLAEARELLEHAITIARRHGLERRMGVLYLGLGTCWVEDDLAAAKEALQAALELVPRYGVMLFIGPTRTNLALCQFAEGHSEEALASMGPGFDEDGGELWQQLAALVRFAAHHDLGHALESARWRDRVKVDRLGSVYAVDAVAHGELLLELAAACGDARRGTPPSADLVERASREGLSTRASACRLLAEAIRART